MKQIIPIEISARHIHLSQKDLEILFGFNYKLTPTKNLSQKGQFAAEEVVEIQTFTTWGLPPHQDFTFGKAPDHNQIRILGPVRQQTQLELSWSDCIILGLTPKVVLSGDYENSFGGAVMVGRKGELKLDKGIIVAQRHIHCSSPKAEKYGLRDGQIVAVKAIGDKSQKSKVKSQIYNSNLKPSTNPVPLRQITFHNVAVRIDPSFDWQMHIDVDEANAAGIRGIGEGKIII